MKGIKGIAERESSISPALGQSLLLGGKGLFLESGNNLLRGASGFALALSLSLCILFV